MHNLQRNRPWCTWEQPSSRRALQTKLDLLIKELKEWNRISWREKGEQEREREFDLLTTADEIEAWCVCAKRSRVLRWRHLRHSGPVRIWLGPLSFPDVGLRRRRRRGGMIHPQMRSSTTDEAGRQKKERRREGRGSGKCWLLTPRICLRSASRKRNGMLDTCNRFGPCAVAEAEPPCVPLGAPSTASVPSAWKAGKGKFGWFARTPHSVLLQRSFKETGGWQWGRTNFQSILHKSIDPETGKTKKLSLSDLWLQ